MASVAFPSVNPAPNPSVRKMVVRAPLGESVEIRSAAVARALAVAIIGTSVSAGSGAMVPLAEVVQFAPRPAQAVSVPEMLRIIRRKTALTWDSLAAIFGVTRRSMHHWANGEALSPENEHKVSLLHERALKLGTEPAFVARATILQEYGLAQEAIPAAPGGPLPILVADQTPISAKVSVSRAPRTRVR